MTTRDCFFGFCLDASSAFLAKRLAKEVIKRPEMRRDGCHYRPAGVGFLRNYFASQWRVREKSEKVKQNSERKNQIMKSRNTLLAAILSALLGFALLPITQAAPAPETPDPGSVGGVLNTADG
jgi:hypothetical protein